MGPVRLGAATAAATTTIVAATRARYIEAYERISSLSFADWIRASGMTTARGQSGPTSTASITTTSSSILTSGCATSPIPRSSPTSRAENTYTDDATAHLEAVAAEDLRGNPGTDQGDRSVGADPPRRPWWYYGRSFEASGTACTAGARSPIPDDWTPPVFDEHTEIAGTNRCCSTERRGRGHDFFALGAVGGESGRPCAGLLRSTSPVTSGTPCGSRTYAAVSSIRTSSPGSHRGDLGGRQRHGVLPDRRRRVAPRHRLAAPAGSTDSDESVYHEPDERFWVAVGRTCSNAYG